MRRLHPRSPSFLKRPWRSRAIKPHPNVKRTPWSQSWADFVTKNRHRMQWTMRELAAASEIDPSYLTLIENNGAIPTRSRVERIGKALLDRKGALSAAGFMPEIKGFVPEIVVTMDWQNILKDLDENSVELAKCLAQYPKERQRELVAQLLTFLRIHAPGQAGKVAVNA